MARSYATLPPATLSILLAATLPAVGEELDPIVSPAGGSLATIAPEAGQRLSELDAAIAAERKRWVDLGEQLRKTTDFEEKAGLELKITETKNRITRLGKSIEQIVIGGSPKLNRPAKETKAASSPESVRPSRPWPIATSQWSDARFSNVHYSRH